jgi:hypothetical protein
MSHYVIHSILFERNKYWTKTKALNWLKKHGYSPIKVDITENHFRFRLVDPELLYSLKAKFRTKMIDPIKKIEFVFAYFE